MLGSRMKKVIENSLLCTQETLSSCRACLQTKLELRWFPAHNHEAFPGFHASNHLALL